MSFNLKKLCEVCQTPIPDSYGNLLCDEHYKARTEVNTQKEVEVKEREEKVVEAKNGADSSIRDPNYTENPQMEDKNQVLANMTQFHKTGIWLWHPTRAMYTTIKNYAIEKTKAHAQFSKHIWKPQMVDVGCGSGVGTNILSQEADFAWGIDKNELSIKFATETMSREKNGMYYSAQLTYDVMDVVEDTRETMKFDFIVCIEIIEHIADWRKFVTKVIHNFAKKDKDGKYTSALNHGKNGEFYNGSEFFFSTPNRNSPKISNDKPKNAYHVREWTYEELEDALLEFFEEVEIFDVHGKPVEDKNITPLLAKCRKPKV